jgi:sigma-E factor negative regulatory protein RseB
MPRRSTRKIAVLGAAALVAFSAPAQEAQDWLSRMNSAIEDLSYRGVFVHMQGAAVETLQIVHINDAGRISERIMSMDGVGREIIRREDAVWCILPDTETVLLEDLTDASPLVAALPSYSTELELHYDFNLHRRTARVAQRRTQVVSIIPKDEFRFGYRLWLDTETAMPLKSQLLDETGQAVEQILFTQIEISASIPKSALEPTINTEGFTLFRPPTMTPPTEQSLSLLPSGLPNGFQLSASMRGSMAGSRYPVNHLVVSDGLATVSVFVEDPKSSPEVAPGYSRLGSANAFSLRVGGRQVTAVGEVPPQTVEAIARSLRAP